MMKSLYGDSASSDKKLGTTLISFTSEIETLKKGELNYKLFSVRCIALALCQLCIVGQIFLFSVMGLFTYLTNWNVLLTFLFCLLTIFASSSKHANDRKVLLATIHIVFELAFISNLMVAFVYWSTIHAAIIGNFEGMQKAFMYYQHSLPQIAFALNFFCTDIVMESQHAIPVVKIGVVYSLVNFTATKINGEPLYWFLTWENIWSPIICFMLCLVTFSGIKVLASCTRGLKPHMDPGFSKTMWDFPQQDLSEVAKKSSKNSQKKKK